MRSKGNRVHVCAVCGEEFHRWTDDAVYCSKSCMSVGYRDRMAGPGNPAWRGGKWKYKGRRWSDIAAAVVDRDSACVDCGTTSGLLAHHLIPQRFWVDLDAANAAENLLTLCASCHPKRPEHYWKVLPDAVFVQGVHIRRPVRRSGAHLRPYPTCIVCGGACKRHRSRFCSYACSNQARWASGVYDPAVITANLGPDPARARWK